VNRAGILDNVKLERDVVFEDQSVHDKVKAIILALMAEMKQENVSNDSKQGSELERFDRVCN